MKNKSILTALFAVVIALFGVRCTDDAEVTSVALETDLSLSSAYIEMTNEGGDYTITIDTDAEWAIASSSEVDWMTLSATSGTSKKDVVATIYENLTISSREVTLVVTAGDNSQAILVTQDRGDETFILTSSLIDIDIMTVTKEANTYPVDLTCNVMWDASTTFATGVSPWFTLSSETGTGNSEFEITVDANPTIETRTGTINFITSGGLTHSYTVMQTTGDAALTIGEVDDIAYYANAAVDLNVYSNTTWTVMAVNDITADPLVETDWISFNRTGTLTGDIELAISATEDNPTALPRTATLKFTYGASDEVVTAEITQEGAVSVVYVESGSQSVAFDADGSTTENITVTSNDNLTVVIPEDAQSWLSVDNATGELGAEFKLTATANEGDARTATVQVVCDSNPDTYGTIVVSQSSEAEDNALALSAYTVHFDSVAAGDETLTVSGDDLADWVVTKTALIGGSTIDTKWLTITGEGTSELKIEVTANATVKERTAEVTITSGSISKVLTITQVANTPEIKVTAGKDESGAYYLDGSEEGQYPAEAGTYWLQIDANDEWSIVDWVDWVTLADGTYNYEGSEVDGINITLTENMSLSDARTEKIYIYFDGKTVRTSGEAASNGDVFTITQAKSTGSLSAEGPSSAFAASGSTTGAIYVSSNVDWTATIVEVECDWITFNNGTEDGTANEESSTTLSFTVAEWDKYSADGDGTRSATIKVTADTNDEKYSEITITQNDYAIVMPTYTIAYVDANNVTLSVANTTFDTVPAAADFTLSYKNTYNGADWSGNFTISDVALSTDSKTLTITTSDVSYNTDELTLTYSGSGVDLKNTVEFELAEAMVIDPTYIEYFNEDFETEGGAVGWTAMSSVTDTISNVDTYYENPCADTVNGSSRVMYVDGVDISYSIISPNFANVVVSSVAADNPSLTFTFDYCMPEGLYAPTLTTTSDGISPTFQNDLAIKGKATATYVDWYTFGDWIGWTTSTESMTWFTKTISVTPSTNAGVQYEEILRLCLNTNYHQGELMIDNISCNNAVARE